MSYSLSFEPAALKEWNSLDKGVQRQVVEENLEIVVLSVGKREDKSVYEKAAKRAE